MHIELELEFRNEEEFERLDFETRCAIAGLAAWPDQGDPPTRCIRPHLVPLHRNPGQDSLRINSRPRCAAASRNLGTTLPRQDDDQSSDRP